MCSDFGIPLYTIPELESKKKSLGHQYLSRQRSKDWDHLLVCTTEDSFHILVASAGENATPQKYVDRWLTKNKPEKEKNDQDWLVSFHSNISIINAILGRTNLIVWASRGEQFFCQTSKIKKKKKSNNRELYSQSNLQLIMFFDITLYAWIKHSNWKFTNQWIYILEFIS